MNMTATIVSLISVFACLFLATRHSGFRALGKGKVLQYALIWAAIIIGLVLVIQLSGFRIER